MKILLLSRYTDAGASSRYRFYQYLPYLRDQDFEVNVAPLLSDFYIRQLYTRQSIPKLNVFSSYARRIALLLQSQLYNLIWIEYEALPWIPYWVESLLFKSNVPYVVDYDDAVFHRYDLHQLSIVRKLLGKKIDRVMSNAALVIAGNEYLAERARYAGSPRVEILPTVIELSRYPIAPHPHNETFTIGWIGSLSTAKYLADIQEALKSVSQDRAGKVVTIGVQSANLDGLHYEIKQPWSESMEIEESFKFDVGIMPLPDSPWERGKCGLKLIKYMACSCPVVASPVGVNREIVEHGVNGFLASSTKEWIKALTTLRDDRTLRERMGKAGRKKVEMRYCTDVAAPRLVSFLREAVKGNP